MKRILFIGLCMMMFAHSKAQNPVDPKFKIEVVINHFRSNNGVVRVSLFNKPNGFPDPKDACRIMNKTIINNSTTLEFDNLPAGEYAISVFHDENNNNKLDTNFLGIPKEGQGASNDARGHFGPPKYRDAKFYLKNGSKTVTINLYYL